MLARMELGTWRTAAGDVDVLLGIPADEAWNLNLVVTVFLGSSAFAVGRVSDIR